MVSVANSCSLRTPHRTKVIALMILWTVLMSANPMAIAFGVPPRNQVVPDDVADVTLVGGYVVALWSDGVAAAWRASDGASISSWKTALVLDSDYRGSLFGGPERSQLAVFLRSRDTVGQCEITFYDIQSGHITCQPSLTKNRGSEYFGLDPQAKHVLVGWYGAVSSVDAATGEIASTITLPKADRPAGAHWFVGSKVTADGKHFASVTNDRIVLIGLNEKTSHEVTRPKAEFDHGMRFFMPKQSKAGDVLVIHDRAMSELFAIRVDTGAIVYDSVVMHYDSDFRDVVSVSPDGMQLAMKSPDSIFLRNLGANGTTVKIPITPEYQIRYDENSPSLLVLEPLEVISHDEQTNTTKYRRTSNVLRIFSTKDGRLIKEINLRKPAVKAGQTN